MATQATKAGADTTAPQIEEAQVFASNGRGEPVADCYVAIKAGRKWFEGVVFPSCQAILPDRHVEFEVRTTEGDGAARLVLLSFSETENRLFVRGFEKVESTRVVTYRREWIAFCGSDEAKRLMCTGPVLVRCSNDHFPDTSISWSIRDGKLLLQNAGSEPPYCELVPEDREPRIGSLELPFAR